MVDVITNSSSELFVLKGETAEIVKEMIANVYPDYLREYEEVKHISELSVDELNQFFSYMCSPHMWPASKGMYPVPPGFTFDELYEPERDYKTGEPEPPAWNGEIQYELRNNVVNPEHKWDSSFVTAENIEEMRAKLDPKGELYFLYSIDENPNWDFQQALERVGERFHLG